MAGIEDTYYKYLKRQHHLATHMELTDGNVINILSELAPYIEADGGWLEFVEIDYMEDGKYVKVRLGGACTTCAYSSQTLKMGIEKRLMEEFDELQGVIQVL